jgi:hypothetical protein
MQSDLANLKFWCKMNSLSLNVVKCYVKSYYRCNKAFNFPYQMAGSVLQRPEYIEEINNLMVEFEVLSQRFSVKIESENDSKLVESILRFEITPRFSPHFPRPS